MGNRNALKWISERTKGQRARMVLLIVFNVLFSVLSVFFALAIKRVVDGAVAGDKNVFIEGAALVLGAIILQFGLRIIINGLTERVNAEIENGLRQHAFSKILSAKYADITAYHSGELMNRLTSDATVVADGVTGILPSLVASIVRLVTAVAVLISLDWVFAVAFAAAGLMVLVVLTVLRGKLKSLHTEVQKAGGKTRSFMQECIENLLAVKAFSAEDKVCGKASDLQDKHLKVRMKRRNYSVTGHAVYNLIFSAGYVFALVYGAAGIYRGSGMTYGALSAILQLVNNVQVPFASISSVFPKYYAMVASAERLIELESVKPEESEATESITSDLDDFTSINVENVTFSYGRERVMEDAYLRINAGEFLVLAGRSGIGKSTLLKLLLGVYSPTEGEIFIETPRGKTEISAATRKLFAYVPQQNMIFSGTIRENLTFVNDDASEEEINAALETCELTEFINSLPNGLDTAVGENGLGISEGQIQRIALCRALLGKAPVLLLDETTSALDEKTERAVLNGLKSLKGVTVIMVSHKKAAESVCDRVITVKNKKFAEE